MTDFSLRLPSTRFRAVLNLGEKRAAAITLPSRFSKPELFADWDDDEETSAVYVAFDDGQLHLECNGPDVAYHFHRGDEESTDTSPWPERDTAVLLEWATALTLGFNELMPDLMDEIEEAGAWHDAGYSIYVCETEPAQLDLLEVEVEGELLTLPWLGAGRVDNEHIDGDNHPIVLLWTPEQADPDQPIAEAWLDPETEHPVTRALPGVDWNAVGLPADEVLSWLEGIYLNHHVIPDAQSALLTAVLERMSGVDGDDSR
ncbi:MAG TPA: hypothetical protein DCP11_05740 [Microbacteriaceae bacterium]|nr:hypothetical protein [Microbacteriaceae bacterium]